MPDPGQNRSPIPGFILGAALVSVAYFADSSIVSWIFGLGGTLALIESGGKLRGYLDQRRRRKAAETPTGTFGTARFASPEDCAAAGLHDPRGLFLGTHGETPLFYTGKAHLLTVAPARKGKGISVVTPNLLHFHGSMLVTDPKGELAAMTARHRTERFGQKVRILNPWGLHGLPQHRFNPLRILVDIYENEAERPGLTGKVREIALQLIPEPEGEANQFFREGARKLLRALMLHFATRNQPDLCTLPNLWRVLQSGQRLEEMLLEMAASDALDGVIADLAEDQAMDMAKSPEHFSDFRQGAVQAVDLFEPSGWLGACTSASDFSFEEMKRDGTTVYLVIPSGATKSHGAWLGLVVRQAIDAVARSQGDEQVLFLLDEATNMGPLHGLAEALTALPGLGVRVWMIVQALSELRRVYGDEGAETILSQAEVKQFFAVQDYQTAKLLSDALGHKTVKTQNYNLGRGDEGLGESRGESGQPLIRPEDITQLPLNVQLLLIQSCPPVMARCVPFWTVAPWRDWVDRNPVEEGPTKTTPRPPIALALDYREE